MSHILFVIESLAEGGTERSLLELLPGLLAAGHRLEIAVLFERDGLEGKARALGVEVVPIRGRGWAQWVRELRRLLDVRSPDLIHSMLFRSDIVARAANRRSDRPLLGSLVGTPYEPVRFADPSLAGWKRQAARAIDRWTARWATHFLAVSQAARRSAIERLGIPMQRITVVPRGRDRRRLGWPDSERRSRVRRALGVPEGDRLVLSVGRQQHQKGHQHLLAAIPRLALAGRPPHFLIVGRPGGASDELEKRRRELGLGDHLRLLGHREDVPDLLAAADLFVSASWSEGMPGAILEAMAMGLPVVASDIAAVREIVEPDASALLVPPGDDVALAAAMSRLLGEPALARRLGGRGMEIFERHFTLEASVRAHLELYAALIDRPAAGSEA